MQEEIFSKLEGDMYFRRNAAKVTSEKFTKILEIIERFKLNPKKVLDVGASNGFLLSRIHEKYKSECYAVEPSQDAIDDGKRNSPFIKFYKSTANSIPFKDSEFDLIVVSFVFHWVDRKNLFKSISEIDRVISDDGFIIISDFFPKNPLKVKYHHLPNESVWTYKQDYSKIFTASNLYEFLGLIEDAHDKTKDKEDENNRTCVILLRKNLDKYPIMDLNKNEQKV